MNACILLCPECGAPLTIDPSARVLVPVAGLLREEPVRTVAVRCIVEHCTRCEWTRERQRLTEPGRSR